MATKTAPTPVWISGPQILQRFGDRSQMWLYRKLKDDPHFPKPTYFGRLRFWRLTQIEDYERQAAARDPVGRREKASV